MTTIDGRPRPPDKGGQRATRRDFLGGTAKLAGAGILAARVVGAEAAAQDAATPATASRATPAAPPAPPAPLVDPSKLREVAPGIVVIEDRDSIPLVPNVTIIDGVDAVLVVDAGLGPRNGEIVFDAVEQMAPGKPMFLTVTHFHPEHGFGAQVFAERATIFYNRGQREEFAAKRDAYLAIFGEFGYGAFLEGVEFVEPDRVYDGATELDLGGRVVTMREVGPAHTLGDQIVEVPDEGVVILGDLLETNSFPIFPWFPEIGDTDVEPVRWREILRDVEGSRPRVVVPGHGPVTTVEAVAALGAYLDLARGQVAAACETGTDLEAVTARVAPVLREAHPEWILTEWIEPEIETYFARECGS